MQKMIKVRHLVSAVLALGVVTVGLIALAPASGASSSSSKAVTYAEQPTTTPNFIFPFYPGSDCSVANADQFQFLMYRPLYWYGVRDRLPGEPPAFRGEPARRTRTTTPRSP